LFPTKAAVMSAVSSIKDADAMLDSDNLVSVPGFIACILYIGLYSSAAI